MDKEYNYYNCFYGQDNIKNERLCAYCTIDNEFISKSKCYDCKNFKDYIFKVKCLEKKFYMWCEVGDILEVRCKIEADERWSERYAVKLGNVIGFYPTKYFEIVEDIDEII